MACGMLAMQKAGIEVDEYIAYEIDKYAIQTATHNFPEIQECGDVFQSDFSQYKDIDYLVGGSPCTYWSIAQKNNRETEASGMGWELFSQYVRALREVKPKFFIYENNKSMSNAIRQSITETFGFEPICINSALVSAQNRQRLYWVGKLNDDGTYSKVDVRQPKDKGILLRDVLDGMTDRDKGRAVIGSTGRTTEREYFKKCQGNMTFEPVGTTKDEKSFAVTAYYSTGQNAPHTLEKHLGSMVAEPVCMRYERSEEAKQVRKQYEAGEVRHGFHELHELHPRQDGKTNTLSTVLKDNPICEPVNTPQRIGNMPDSKGNISTSQGVRIYSQDGKSVTLSANGGGMGAKTGLYAIPVEFDGDVPTKAKSGADGKTYTVYKVADGIITIKNKTYPIKLVDGYYIIRKLTVSECKRLQTVPEWFEFPVSDSQAYKMLGNGWTVDVIAHILNEMQRN